MRPPADQAGGGGEDLASKEQKIVSPRFREKSRWPTAGFRGFGSSESGTSAGSSSSDAPASNADYWTAQVSLGKSSRLRVVIIPGYIYTQGYRLLLSKTE